MPWLSNELTMSDLSVVVRTASATSLPKYQSNELSVAPAIQREAGLLPSGSQKARQQACMPYLEG